MNTLHCVRFNVSGVHSSESPCLDISVCKKQRPVPKCSVSANVFWAHESCLGSHHNKEVLGITCLPHHSVCLFLKYISKQPKHIYEIFPIISTGKYFFNWKIASQHDSIMPSKFIESFINGITLCAQSTFHFV